MGVIRQIGFLITALTALLIGMPAAQAQTITNVAAARWSQGSNNFSVNSNAVTFSVMQQTLAIQTFTGDAAGQRLPISAPTCGGNPLILPGGTGTSQPFATVSPTTALRVGSVFYFQIDAPAANPNAGAIDRLVTTLTTASGDLETLTIYETAATSGVFVGAIQTAASPLGPVQGDCRLSVSGGDRIGLSVSQPGSGITVAMGQLQVLADPYGLVFDSETGAPVNGVRVTMVDALTGAPAQVFADDGVTPWPATVYSGQNITDGAGNVYQMAPGEYRFPLAALGQYRLVIAPPAPYTAPSVATAVQLAALRRPDGQPMVIAPASFGGPLTLGGPSPVRIDIPLDHPAVSVTLTKTVSRPTARPGDVIFYTVTVANPDPLNLKRGVTLVDVPSPLLRLRRGTVRIDGIAAPNALQTSADGSSLTLPLGDIAAGDSRTITYAMTVRADAPAGQALNRATATDARGISASTGATLRIERNDLAARMTIIGRITAGGCTDDAPHNGIPGVRLMLEDGTFAVTDAEGRYHFNGVVPGTHVVQAQTATLPKGGAFTDCTRSTRSAGSATSRFVTGQGGSLMVADFSAKLPEGSHVTRKQPNDKSGLPAIVGAPPLDLNAGRVAAGADTDWLALGDGPTAFLFPAPDHNPRAPAVRVVVRHRAGQKVDLLVDGKPADKLSFDGQHAAPGGTYAVSIWRGIPLDGEVTQLTAAVRDEQGKELSRLPRRVIYSATPARVELLPAASRLIADGTTRPVLALRILDHNDRPVHAGLSGEFGLSAPYESAEAIDAMQQRQLSGLGRQSPRWTVRGDDGMAYVELAPTMVSGKLHLTFNFSDNQQRRRQELDTWVVPGDQPWTLVGLVEGTVGARTIADAMERPGRLDSDLGDHARTAFYVKGRMLGKFLLTASYDSAKQRDDQVLMGAIDPRAYYTVFADGSHRQADAPSREKLYVRVESRFFYAIYGDFGTGFDQTQLGRYQRTATGFKGEINTGGVHVQGFAAKIASTHRRDEFQGGGISGPYRLSSRALISGSEVVSIEVRDRFRSEVIVSRRALTRFVDYDVDLLSGTISFKEPILGRDAQLNPQFIVIDYELDETARGGQWNAGLRADVTMAKGNLRFGATAISDTSANGGNTTRTNLVAVDAKARLGQSTEVRAEAAVSQHDGEDATAFLVEVEHHSGKLDLLGYVRASDAQFGVGQTTGAEQGRRKVGIDTRVRITPDLSVETSGWIDDSLTDGTRRVAVQTGLNGHTARGDARLGFAHFDDRLADGMRAKSDVIEASVSRRFMGNKLELSAATSFAIGKSASIDLPERHRFSARYAVSLGVKLVGTYEIAVGANIDARTARIGLEVTPWEGARIVSALGQQDIAEHGKRSFAAFGLAQSIPATRNLTLDATLDSNRTVGGVYAPKLINPAHPAASGGMIGDNGTIGEDFTALTFGGTWQAGKWSATGRGEWRDGQFANRRGVIFGAIRQLGDGAMLGTGFTWTRADADSGAASEVFDGALAAASRPAGSNFAFLIKLQYRSDRVRGAVEGETGPAGRTALTVTGDAHSDRLIASVSGDWTPRSAQDGQVVQRSNVGFFLAARHNFDSYDGLALGSTTLIGGLDLRYGLGDHFEVGAVGSARHNLTDRTSTFSYGPQIGLSPSKGVQLLLGYNFSGYRDADFSAARSTDQGLFVTVRLKLDAGSFQFLGLGQ